MADTTLQLNITANSNAAEQALNRLATALRNVKAAVGKGMGLGPAATAISKVVTALGNVPDAAVTKLQQIATALSQISSFGNMNLNISADSVTSAGAIQSAFAQAAISAQQMGTSISQAVTQSQTFAMNMKQAAGAMGSFNNFNPFSQNAAQGAMAPMTNVQDIMKGTAGYAQDMSRAIYASALNSGTLAGMIYNVGQNMVATANAAERAATAMLLMMGITQQSANASQVQTQSIQQAADSAQNARQSMQATGDAVRDVGNKANSASSDVRKFSDSLKELVATQKHTKSALGNLIGQFFRIMKMRAIRYVIREITKSIKEGLDNYKQYSKAIGGDYYNAVTRVNDATLKMKNSIGAALAPAIQMLIPHIINLVNWFINLMNVVNQFLALLNGQSTWSKAVDVSSEAFEETKKKANEAGSAIKELLADWDELNIIQSESGGGGGSGNLTETYDYTQMFTEVSKFDEKIRKVVQFIKDNIDTIKKVAGDIGLIIAGWEISGLLGGAIGTLVGWATTGVIGAAVFNVNMMFDEKYLEDGDPGWVLGNILTTAFGGVLAMTLLQKLTGSKGAAYAAVSIILGVSATADLVAAIGDTDVSALDQKNLALAVLAALKLGLATTFIGRSLIGLGWGNAALLGLGATGLVFGAEVGIKAIIGDIETGAITQESIAAKALSALTIGSGIGLTAKGVGMKLPMAAMTGLAAAMLTASVYLMIDLWTGKVRNNYITLDSVARVAGLAAASALGFKFLGKAGIKAFAGTNALAAAGFVVSLTLGIRAIIGKLTNPGEITLDDIIDVAGSAVAAGIGTFVWVKGLGLYPGKEAIAGLAAAGLVVTLIMGIRVLLSSYEDVDASGINDDVLIETAGAAAGAALTIFSWSKMHGLSLTESAQGALAAAGFVATVILGIRVIVGSVNAKEINEDSIKAALGVGAVGGLSTAMVLLKGGASIAAAAAAGLGAAAAIATGIIVFAAVGIALTVGNDTDNITWGNETLTESQVQAFVQNKMFYSTANVDLDLISSKVTLSEQQRTEITKSAREVIGTIYAVKLGIDESSTLLSLYGQITTLLDKIKTYAAGQVTVLSTGVSIVPVITKTGENISDKVLTQGINGWQEVTNYMNGLGYDLADAMIESTTGQLKTNWDVEAVETILEKVRIISESVLGAQVNSEAAAALKVQTLGMKDLTKDSVTDVLKYYQVYEKQLSEGYTKMYTEQYTSFYQLASYYRGMAEIELRAGNEELYNYYMEQAKEAEDTAKEIMDGLEGSVEARVKEAGSEGRRIIKGWLDAMIPEPVKDAKKSWEGVWAEYGGFGDTKRAIRGLAAEAIGIPVEALEILDITGWEYLSEDLQQKILRSLVDAFGSEAVENAFDGMGIQIPVEITPEVKTNNESIFQDIMDDIEYMSKDPANLFNELVGTYGAEYYKEILSAMMQTYGWSIDDILSNLNGNTTLSTKRLEELTNLATQFKEGMSVVDSPDISGFEEGMNKMEESAKSAADGVRASMNSLNGITIGFTGGIFGGRFNVTMPEMMASGGFVDVGEMFIAREAGPEMVGRIGSRSAVANNDQIVNSIQGGVEAGMRNANDGTDQLLGQAVSLLSQILRRTGTMQPSASHGRVIRQSLDLYERSGG